MTCPAQSLEQVLAQINALNRSLEGIIEVRSIFNFTLETLTSNVVVTSGAVG